MQLRLNQDAFVLWHLGAVLGSLALHCLAAPHAFTAAGMSALAAATLLAVTPEPGQPVQPTPADPEPTGLWALVLMLARDPRARAVLVADAATLVTPRMDFVPLLDAWHVGADTLSHVHLTTALAALLCSPLPRPSAGPASHAALGFLVIAACAAALPVAPPPLLWAVLAVRAAGMSCAEPAEKCLWALAAPARHRGLFIGLQHTVRGVQQTLGTFVTAYLAAAHVALPYLAIAACNAFTAAVYWRARARTKQDE